MPKVVNLPKNLKPYAFHGVQFDYSSERDDVYATCPFCAKDKKFSISVKTGQWRCLSCNEGVENDKAAQGGNVFTFMRILHKHSMERKVSPKVVNQFLESRGLLSRETLDRWGVCRSILDDTWLVPGYSPDGKLNNLYRYIKESNGRHRLYATPECNHCLHGVNLWDSNKGYVAVCEGPWDAMCLWEVMKHSRSEEGYGLVLTGNEENSLLSITNVIAVPGCNVFNDSWKEMLGGRKVSLLYDNDHSKKHPKTNRVIPPAGYSAMQRVSQMMATAESLPQEVRYVAWGPEGVNEELPDGYDLRDWLCQADDQKGRTLQLQRLQEKIVLIPSEWVIGRAKSSLKGRVDIDSIVCEKYTTLINQWKKPMKWIDGLDVAFSVMLASITSVKSMGDQLWVRVVGPASGGKTTMCEALALNRKHVIANSTMRGFHSGYKSDGKGEEDNALVAQLYDKTLITKDGDTLLESPNLSQILSEARDIYDSNSRVHYRNRVNREYNGIRMTWILCGTSSLYSLDSSELGERFITVVIMDEIDDDLEDEILWRKVNQAAKNMALESNGKIESQHDPDLVVAMQMTAGYVDYLRSNASRLLAGVEISTKARRQCMFLGKMVAHMRARPSKRQEEVVERELGARLSSQFTRLAGCLAVVLNKSNVDEEVMRRVRKVAMDTARGKTLDIISRLREEGSMEVRQLSAAVHVTEERLRTLLRFMRQLKVVENFKQKLHGGTSNVVKWRLTERMDKIYDEALNDTEDSDE